MTEPGRHCPLRYRTQPEDLDTPAQITADTLYVVGGLYGNPWALRALHAVAEAESRAGLPAPTLVFNGDFNWFNAEDSAFHAINTAVMQYEATQGNVEAELSEPAADAGCGCAYPQWIDSATVASSNAIMTRLQDTASKEPQICRALGALPRTLTASVGEQRIGIVHGDPDSLAGWNLAVESMPPPGTTTEQIAHWFRAARVDIIASTHTCLAFMQDFRIDGARRLVINNGAAGMPNFRGDRRGVITRISRFPTTAESLYGTTLGPVYCDAVGVHWACPQWDAWFTAIWPEGSPAARSYIGRLRSGPAHARSDARRLTQNTPARTT
ncbi:metallophosphoesterase [Aquisalimonas sp.]|uniref:metallophosphoesterase family protein n=1 Tax=Aquisalimonas sp. TaxID=1872621 RepID=UPI0025C19F4E|nr:metallophosphoesterase [Aquisalimonas sp.]